MFTARFIWEEPKGTKTYDLIDRVLGMSEINRNSSKIKVDFNNSPFGNYTKVREGDVYVIGIDIPLLEDFSYEVQSTFQDFKDVLSEIPLLGKILDLFQTINKVSSTVTGKTMEGSEYLKFQAWEKTEPFKMNIKGIFDNKTSSYYDVYLPSIMLMNQNIISIGTDGKLYTPGLNLQNIQWIKKLRDDNKKTKDGPGAENKSDQEKMAETTKKENTIVDRLKSGSNKVIGSFQLLTKNINGEEVRIIDVAPCFIEIAKPTWSKEQTTAGLPLWCELEIQIQSVFSAHDNMFAFYEPPLISQSFEQRFINNSFR